MLKWIGGIALGLVVGVAGFLGFVATKPDNFRLERSTLIAAPPEKIVAQLEDFHAWGNWSPWEAMEKPGALKRTYSGAEKGVGAEYHWEGPETGEGHMKIVEVKPGAYVKLELHFIKPFEAHNLTEFTVSPQEKGFQQLSWAMSGPQPFVAKLMCTFFSMEEMVGPDFEKGLAKLKLKVEQP